MTAIPERALQQHTAILGKTGSGKTSTAKLLVEQVVAAGARVCILDPLKSDWWGLTSSADGKRAGLPFHILGGPRGHVPLHSASGAAIAEVVASGALPLSIIDMADFEPGGQTRFFVDFAPMLLRKVRGVVYLVVEEAHVFVPKERAGLDGGKENLSIHWGKTLATGSRSKGIRLVVLTQRTQALHNAVIGSCDTMIAHRLTAPADQKPVTEWLKANAPKASAEEISGNLGNLKTGTAWLCSGEAQIFDRIAFQRIKTFDNTSTPTGDAEASHIATAKVDVEQLKALVGDAVKEAEANDPKLLRKRVSDLEAKASSQAAELAACRRLCEEYEHTLALERAAEKEVSVLTPEDRAGLIREAEIGLKNVEALEGYVARLGDALTDQRDIVSGIERVLALQAGKAQFPRATPPANGSRTPAVKAPTAGPRPVDRSHGPADISRPQQAILDALAYFESIGIDRPSRRQTALVARVSSVSSGYEKNVSTLSTLGLISYPGQGLLQLTPAGRANAQAPAEAPSTKDLQDALCARLSGPQAVLLRVLIKAYPNSLRRPAVAERAAVSPESSGFEKNVSTLRSLGLIDYPMQGHLVASPVLFLEKEI